MLTKQMPNKQPNVQLTNVRVKEVQDLLYAFGGHGVISNGQAGDGPTGSTIIFRHKCLVLAFQQHAGRVGRVLGCSPQPRQASSPASLKIVRQQQPCRQGIAPGHKECAHNVCQPPGPSKQGAQYIVSAELPSEMALL